MDLHQLFVFTKAVEHKSFSKAAENIFLSQSTVSSHIQALEKSLNLQLFDRDGRETLLTPHGERLYAWAQQILLLRDEAILDLKQGMIDFSGNVRIASSSVPSSYIIPNMIKLFCEEYPRITFHLTEASSKHVADHVLKRTVDIGILGEKYVDDRLCYLPIQKEKLVFITANHVKIENLEVSFDEIIKHPLIMRHSDSGTQSWLNKLLKKNGVSKEQLNIKAYTDSGNSIIQFVKEGIGVSIISELAAKEYTANNTIRMYNIKDFDDERYFYLVYHKNKTLSLAAKLFIDNVKGKVSDPA